MTGWNAGVVIDTPFGSTPGIAPTTGMAVRGAVNLLVKAGAAWDVLDDEKATRMIDRAAGLPWVAKETVWPGPYAAHLMLFELLVHTIETGRSGDWFVAVESTFAALDDTGRDHLCDALAPVVSDWDLDPDLSTLVRDLVGSRADEHRWMTPDLSAADVRAGTESVLRVAVRLSDELGQRGLCSHLAPEGW